MRSDNKRAADNSSSGMLRVFKGATLDFGQKRFNDTIP